MQSDGLSDRIKKYNSDGNHFTDDSIQSEKVMEQAINQNIKEYAHTKINELFPEGELIIRKKVSVYELKKIQQRVYSDAPIPHEKEKTKFITPDGGIWFLKLNEKEIPILIIEDKKQGTNDKLFSEGRNKQSTGNAIERFAKNVRACEMLFHEYDIFPYVLFASGCDFHPSETISDRIVVGNYGYPNHQITIDPSKEDGIVYKDIIQEIEKINIKKKFGKDCVMIPFIKSHKWDEMPHNSSNWKIDEIIIICHKVLDLSFESILKVDT